MKSKDSLEAIKNIIDNTYNRFGRSLLVNTSKPYNPQNSELGYCYKYTDPTGKFSQYKIVCSRCGDEAADFRVLMHEYGHIYLAHLEGIHEELDNKIAQIIEEDRDVLIQQINETCGIDYADKLLNRIIDDPVLNHSLHNIAMDMEVNSTVLDLEDIELMEKNITKFLTKYEREQLQQFRDDRESEEEKKVVDEVLKRMENEAKIKFIHPSRYHFPDETPFPDNLDYPGYLILIIKHLDQFVKMMISIKKGGNGDTSGITCQDVQDALNGNNGNGEGEEGQAGNGEGEGEGGSEGKKMDYSNPNGGMKGLDSLMEEMGLKDPSDPNNPSNNPTQGPRQGTRSDGAVDENSSNWKDHMTNERQEADRKRELGQITGKGGLGCGNSGGPGATRKVDQMADEVEMALQEVIQNYSSKIVDITTKKDMMYLWNRGINRNKIIVPSYKRKYDIKTNPTITFLIDISGSMDTRLVDRILKTISNGMRRLARGLKYNIITWSTRMGEELKNLDPRRPVPSISCGGGTEMAGGMRYFKENYGKESILVLISDFEDYLEEWHRVEETMDGYTMYGFNYGNSNYYDPNKIKWKNFKVRNFKQHRNGY